MSLELEERITSLETAVTALARSEFGDIPGHEFHGNQYTMQVDATYESPGGEHHPEHPQGVSYNIKAESHDEAKHIASQFAKSHGVRAVVSHERDGSVTGHANGNVTLKSDRVNGGVNETGLKRFEAVMKRADALGIKKEWSAPWGNSYKTEADFRSALKNASQS